MLHAIKARVGVIPEGSRPRVYYARGQKGLTPTRRSIMLTAPC
jgi:hypothetical protein